MLRIAVLPCLVSLAAFGAEPQPQTADDALQLKLRTVEEQMTDLKERIIQSKERLREVERIVFGGDPRARASLVVRHHDDVGPAYRLESIAYALDAAPVFTRVGAVVDGAEVFHGYLLPGPHQLTVRAVYRGTGLGFFPYHQGYRVTLTSSQTLSVEPGEKTLFDVTGTMSVLSGALGIEYRIGKQE